MCAAIATSALACGVDADRDNRAPSSGAEVVADAGAEVVADATAAAADGCVVAAAGDGFVHLPLADATALDTLTFTVTASAPAIDAVIGLSAGPATSFASLATSVRLAPGGTLDARDGDGYRADVAQAYATNPIDVRVIADLPSHTYSVFEGTPMLAQEIARGYRFRTGQQAVTHLDQLAVIVDGTQGSVTVCQPRATPSSGVVYSHEGRFAVLPQAGGGALISDGTVTRRLDAAGRTVAQLANGGELAVDAAGHVLVAKQANDAVTVSAYDGTALLWQATRAVPPGSVVQAITADAAGVVHVGLATLQGPVVTVVRVTSAGAALPSWSATGQAVALDGGAPIVASSTSDTLQLTRFTADGAVQWTRAFAGSAAVTALTIDPDHAVIFGGELFTPIDFGGGTLPTRRSDNGPFNGYVVRLDATGAHVFSRRTEFTLVGGVAANASTIVVSSTERTQFRYHHLQRFDPRGNPVATAFELGLGEHGVGGRIAIDDAGRVWWNLETLWPLFPSWPYLVALTP